MPIIRVESVSKVFRARRGHGTLLGREGIGRWLRRALAPQFTALKDVSLEVNAGESVGIIGRNGSGKSTLLRLIAGVTLPTTGSVTVNGRVASLLELGAGFHPMLTGRENVYLNAGLLGVRHAEVDKLFERIVEFSGIGDFIEQPVETYSSGMYVRLAFAVAVHSDPDVFLVDEVLSVGDEEFQRKSRRRIGELREQGKTIVFVSHDLGLVSALCERVYLLHEGRLIDRGTPHDTVEYYLRLVEGARGVRAIQHEDTEAVVAGGKISLYRQRRELSAGTGFRTVLLSLQTEHPSTDAAWEFGETAPDKCQLKGTMPRLPVAHRWTLRVADGCLVWRLEIDCDRETSLDAFDVQLPLSAAYTEWIYGDLMGVFPDIEPGDVTWSTVVEPEAGCHEAAALAPEDSGLPPLRVRFDSPFTFPRARWANSDYIAGCRVFTIGARFPERERVFAAGRHELLTVTVDPTATAQELKDSVCAERTLTRGGLAARFEHGRVLLSYKGEELTLFLHAYTSMLINNLWNDSSNLQWESVVRSSDGLQALGRSRRFPYRQHWTLMPEDGGIAWTVELEALEPLDVQEYHASVVLRDAFTRWENEHENGSFPVIDASQNDWRHLNRDYTPARCLKAAGEGVPEVSLEADPTDMLFRMTPINTSHGIGGRVLQALRVPDAGVLRFDAGRHLLFAGRIRVGGAPTGFYNPPVPSPRMSPPS